MLAQNWKTELYLKSEAIEEVIKKANSPKILHIATHGFFFEDVKKKDELNGKGNSFFENPLLRSGLVFAGVNNTINRIKSTNFNSLENRKTEDGILTAYEVMNLTLYNTELVVLSACGTGLGDIKNGEGVYGLQRAFKVAGAKNIIMSLWNVDDKATQELMSTFYTIWLKSGDLHNAFRESQLKSIKSKANSHPRYWGAFVRVGE